MGEQSRYTHWFLKRSAILPIFYIMTQAEKARNKVSALQNGGFNSGVPGKVKVCEKTTLMQGLARQTGKSHLYKACLWKPSKG